MKSGYTLTIFCAVLVVLIAALAVSSFVTSQTFFGVVGLVVAVFLLIATVAQFRKAGRR